ncbi:MAG: hypothetical protein WBL74_10580 [Novosphingobium sp.]|uniref:hypothetical protein n=1 Tax=Novosphingobium sp. TaxID=1874826 RepID=UPI003C7DB48B
MRSPAQIMQLMANETRLRPGSVPRTMGGVPIPDNARHFAGGQFVLRTGTGYAFHYAPGEGVAVERSAEADPAEEELWRFGSVYAAVACLNGLYPLHASAVAWEGRVHAFTGPSGAGKSTLVAGLGQRGLPLFCDDTLLLSLDDPARIVALPGHKRLKLTDTALSLSGAQTIGPVGSDTGKSYAAPPNGDLREPCELASLTFLEQGDETALKPIIGAERFARLEDDHYTQALYLEAQTPSNAALFALRARLAGRITMARLIRPFAPEEFAKSVDLAETAIRQFA